MVQIAELNIKAKLLLRRGLFMGYMEYYIVKHQLEKVVWPGGDECD